jgi:predicted ATPase
MKKIVITGGSFAGKTSLIELFKESNYVTLPDFGLQVINELNAELGINEQKEYRKQNSIAFYTKIIKEQIKSELNIKSDIVILDRGVYDYLAMLDLSNKKVPKELIELVQNIKYDLIFVCDTLTNFNARSDSGRLLTKEESLKLNELLVKYYSSICNNIIYVKEMPLKERFEFIKSYL